MKRSVFAVLIILALAGSAFAQTTTTQTTLSAAVTSVTQDRISVASATGFTAGSTYAFINGELMKVLSVSGTSIGVARGQNGTRPVLHLSGAVVWVGPFSVFRAYDPAGSCTATAELYLPQINVANARIWNCVNSRWQGITWVPFADGRLPRTPVSNAAYTAKLTDVVIAMTSLTAARTITLPSATGLDGKYYIIQDESGQAGSYTITIAGTVNGSGGGTVINSAYGVSRLRSNGTAWFIW